MRRLRKGDSRAMKETYDRYIGGLTSLCSRYVADAEDVKDILQECFVKIFGSIDSFEYLGEGSLNAWMSRIVVNRAISFVRNYESFESLDILSDIPVVEDDDPPPQQLMLIMPPVLELHHRQAMSKIHFLLHWERAQHQLHITVQRQFHCQLHRL